MDLNPLTTPNNVLTDCLNGTLITYDGNEFVLQNDKGNCKVDQARLTPGFIPMGMKEYGGIIYIVSYNPITGAAEYGSFPSPQRDFSTTDYGNIGPVEFTNTQFILDNGITTEQVTKVIGKLFEPELFTLHPGDMYVVTYDINPGHDIHDEATYEQYISKDPASRKVFALKFYKITDDNNLTALDSSKVNVIPDQDDLDGEYAYFTENSNSTLAVGLEFESLDSFGANVIDTSLKTNSNKKVTIEAVGTTASLNTFLGVKVDVTLPSVQSFFIEKTSTNKKVSATIDGLSAGDQFQCTVTPYCQYCLFPKLKQDFILTLGTYIDGSSGVNNIFRYYTDLSNNYVKIDFDYKFQGDSDQGIHLYVEIYDPWSDFSILRTVDNPTYYGINSVTVELNNETTIDQFDSTTVGGTLPSKLITNTDTTYEKTILNSTNLIHSDSTLKKNHFYIVRISGVDRTVDSDGNISYTHYDFYKGLYTNTMFNSTYSLQSGLSTTDPSYVADFNTLDFDLSGITYDNGVVPSTTGTGDLTPVVTTQRDDLTTNGSYYKVSPTVLSTTPAYKYTKTYENKKVYNVNLTLVGTDMIFGNFKDSLLSVGLPAIQDSDGTTPDVEQPVVVDDGYDGNNNISTNSVARWQIATVTPKANYTVSTDVLTSRSVYSPVSSTTKTARVYADVPLLPSLYYRTNNDSSLTTPGYSNPKATVRVNKYDVDIMKENGSVVNLHSDDGIQDVDLTQAINTAFTRTYSAFIMNSSEQTWTYTGAHPQYNSCNDTVPVAAWKQCNMLMRGMDGGQWKLTQTIDPTAIIQFFSSLFVASNVTSTVNVYYPNGSSTVANGNIVTTATYPDLPFTTNFTPDGDGSGGYIKTYLSTFRMHANNSLGDFKADTLNSYIDSRKGDSVIIDGKDTLRDGFIPYIDTIQQSTSSVSIPAVVITQAGDNSIVTKYNSGSTQYQNDPAFNDGPHTHGALWTNNPTLYGNIVPDAFTVNNVTTNTPVNPNTVFIAANTGTPTWAGVFTKAGSCSGKTASPSMFPSFAISKQ